MKKIINKTATKIVGILVLIIMGFTIYQSTVVQEETQLIIGTWICESDTNWKIKFESNGICYQYYIDEPDEEYTFTIEGNMAPNNVEHTILKLIIVNQPSEILDYEINGLSDNDLYLDYLGDMSVKLIHFRRQ